MSEPLRLLSIGAHPADIFDQSGGTMAHHAARGDFVACVVLTHGARVHDAEISEAMFHRDEIPGADELEAMMVERAAVKAAEVRRACDILGVQDLRFFDADDALLQVDEEMVRRLARLLREIRPDVILTHFPKERSYFASAHATAGQIALNAMNLAAAVDPGDHNPPHKIAQVFFFGTGATPIASSVWDAERGFYNDVFVDIEDVIDKKLAVLDQLVSQGYAGAYARKRIQVGDGGFGGACGCAYAEGFIKMNHEVHHYLPVTDRARSRARASDHEVMASYSRIYDPESGEVK